MATKSDKGKSTGSTPKASKGATKKESTKPKKQMEEDDDDDE